MLPGTLAGSPNDRLFLIGAHYDTVRTTAHGADDNGSGVAAMLQVAKQIATGMLSERGCVRSMFIVMILQYRVTGDHVSRGKSSYFMLQKWNKNLALSVMIHGFITFL